MIFIYFSEAFSQLAEGTGKVLKVTLRHDSVCVLSHRDDIIYKNCYRLGKLNYGVFSWDELDLIDFRLQYNLVDVDLNASFGIEDSLYLIAYTKTNQYMYVLNDGFTITSKKEVNFNNQNAIIYSSKVWNNEASLLLRFKDTFAWKYGCAMYRNGIIVADTFISSANIFLAYYRNDSNQFVVSQDKDNYYFDLNRTKYSCPKIKLGSFQNYYVDKDRVTVFFARNDTIVWAEIGTKGNIVINKKPIRCDESKIDTISSVQKLANNQLAISGRLASNVKELADNYYLRGTGFTEFINQWNEIEMEGCFPEKYEIHTHYQSITGRRFCQLTEDTFLLVAEGSFWTQYSRHLDYFNDFTIHQGRLFEIFTSTIYNMLLASNTTTESLDLYPNPVSNTLNFNKEMSGYLQLFDFQNRKVYAGRIRSNELDVSSLKAGMYIVRMQSPSGQTYTSRFIKN